MIVTASVQNLKKVTVSLQVSSNGDSSDLSTAAEPFSFIFGIGSTGLSPFEMALCDKTPGEAVEVLLSGGEMDSYFSHMFFPLRQALGLHLLPNNMFMRLQIMAVEDADPREIVRTLAKGSGHGGCGGSCDCGCG